MAGVEGIRALELDLQVVVRHKTLVLTTKPRSSERAECALES